MTIFKMQTHSNFYPIFMKKKKERERKQTKIPYFEPNDIYLGPFQKKSFPTKKD